jgi:hypothetical protein
MISVTFLRGGDGKERNKAFVHGRFAAAYVDGMRGRAARSWI